MHIYIFVHEMYFNFIQLRTLILSKYTHRYILIPTIILENKRLYRPLEKKIDKFNLSRSLNLARSRTRTRRAQARDFENVARNEAIAVQFYWM